jgi:hypothetical protein
VKQPLDDGNTSAVVTPSRAVIAGESDDLDQNLGHISNRRRRQLVVGHEDRLERLSFGSKSKVRMNVTFAVALAATPRFA